MTEAGKQKTRERMTDFNPMKTVASRRKSSLSHLGKVPWNKGLTADEYMKHFVNGVKGGRKSGYQHTLTSREKMSTIRSRMLEEGTIKIGKLSDKGRENLRNLMRNNRKDSDFNKKMFSSLMVSITKPHLKVKKVLDDIGVKTETNMAYRFGIVDGSIDEVIPEKKVAIYVDGNYWHNYPLGRRWDRYCTKFLENRGWTVLRLWESEINEDIEKCRERIINLTK